MRRKSLHGSEPVAPQVESIHVVVSHEIRERACPRNGGAIRSRVRPFLQAGPDAAFRVAVGLRRVGTRPLMADPEVPADVAKPRPDIGAAVGGQPRADADSLAGLPPLGSDQKRTGTRGRFVGQERGVGEPGPIVDREVQVVIAGPRAAAGVIAVKAVPDAAKPPQLLDVQVHQLARLRPLVAHDGRRC